jgi:hypothetical protein
MSPDAGTAAGGTGSARQGVGGANGRSSRSTGSAAASSATAPPWKSPAWSADVSAAREAIEAARVPAGYRDLIRDYFDRP